MANVRTAGIFSDLIWFLSSFWLPRRISQGLTGANSLLGASCFIRIFVACSTKLSLAMSVVKSFNHTHCFWTSEPIEACFYIGRSVHFVCQHIGCIHFVCGVRFPCQHIGLILVNHEFIFSVSLLIGFTSSSSRSCLSANRPNRSVAQEVR